MIEIQFPKILIITAKIMGISIKEPIIDPPGDSANGMKENKRFRNIVIVNLILINNQQSLVLIDET